MTQYSIAKLSVKSLARIAIVAAVAIVFLKSFVIGFYRVPSDSMTPALLVGDFVVVEKLSRTFENLKSVTLYWFSSGRDSGFRSKGEVVVFVRDESDDGEEYLVKRIAGIPGDTVEQKLDSAQTIREIVPYAGMEIILDESNIDTLKYLIEAEGNRVEVRNHIVYINNNSSYSYTLRDNYYYVLGDNAGNSYDSRYFGFVSASRVIGSPLFIYWSVDHDTTGSTLRWNRLLKYVR